MAAIVELCRRSPLGIFAITYRGRHRGRTIRLPDGAIVETPTPDRRCEAPDELEDCFAVATGGVPGTVHHANLGLISGYLALEGVFLLPSGDVAAVYGAEAVPLGRATVPAP